MAKCLSWGFYIPEVLSCPAKSTLEIVHSKSHVHSHDPKFLFPHRYKRVPSVYNKNTSKWSSNAQMWSKYELYTPKPSQLHEQCNKSATVNVHMELLLTTTTCKQSRSGATPLTFRRHL